MNISSYKNYIILIVCEDPPYIESEQAELDHFWPQLSEFGIECSIKEAIRIRECDQAGIIHNLVKIPLYLDDHNYMIYQMIRD